MNRLVALSLSMLLLLVALPLISFGTTQGPSLLWWLGFLALVVGGLIPPAARLLAPGQQKPRTTRAGMADDERV